MRFRSMLDQWQRFTQWLWGAPEPAPLKSIYCPKSMKHYCPRPSDAIRAMIDGLREIPDQNFRVRMDYFGGHAGTTCFGCAATCAVQHAVGIRFTQDNIEGGSSRASATGLSHAELQTFERMIDSFRAGFTRRMEEYYGVRMPKPKNCWYLGDGEWECQLPTVEDYLEQVIAAGL